MASLVLAAGSGPGASAARAQDYRVGIATTYDDNILNYSERDLFTFRNRLNPTRYALKTTDDLVTEAYIEAAWAPDSTRSTSVLARLEVERYATNGIRNNAKALLQWRARLSDCWRIGVVGSFVPSYYVRRYIDYDAIVPYPELSRYRDARYRQAECSASAEWRPRSHWRPQLAYTFARRDYRDAFPERDQNRHRAREMHEREGCAAERVQRQRSDPPGRLDRKSVGEPEDRPGERGRYVPVSERVEDQQPPDLHIHRLFHAERIDPI